MNSNKRKNTGYSNRPFDQALAGLREPKDTRSAVKVPVYDELPKVNNGEIDGRDHINIHHHANTDLGLALSTFGEYSLIHPRYGSFLTVHGLICWLMNPNQPDSYRSISAKEIDLSFRGVENRSHMPDYSYQVLWATWYKIKSQPRVERWLKDSTLKFEHYYLTRVTDVITGRPTDNVIRIRNKSSWWMIKGVEELRAALVQNREPNLDMFLTQAGREKLERQRNQNSVAAVSQAPRETDVIMDVQLKNNEDRGIVRKVRTPEQKERRRELRRRYNERRRERAKNNTQLTNPPTTTEVSDHSNPCAEVLESGGVNPCVVGMHEVSVAPWVGENHCVVDLFLVHEKDETPEQLEQGLDKAVADVQALIDNGATVTMNDIDFKYVRDINGEAYLKNIRLNGVVLATITKPLQGC